MEPEPPAGREDYAALNLSTVKLSRFSFCTLLSPFLALHATVYVTYILFNPLRLPIASIKPAFNEFRSQF
mgnify:FL=1|jgi:hypothetical protein